MTYCRTKTTNQNLCDNGLTKEPSKGIKGGMGCKDIYLNGKKVFTGRVSEIIEWMKNNATTNNQRVS